MPLPSRLAVAFRPRLLDCLPGYSKADFSADFGAGLTVALVALPLAMAFGIASGVRPEALHLASGADHADFCFDTAVDVVEPLGNEILINFRAGGAAMVTRVDPAVRVKSHQNIRVALDPGRVHFFDEKSGAAI